MKQVFEQYLERLATFEGRDEDLVRIERYSLYPTMFYRTNLLRHSRRVGRMTAEVVSASKEILGATFDGERAIALALVHDDAEIVFGDIQAGNKSKMTEEQLKEVELAEQRAIDEVIKRFPEYLGSYRYQDLLKEGADLTSLESRVVKCIDKFDAFGEALHEVYAGNTAFTTNVVNEYGTIPIPPDYYVSWYQEFYKKHPNLEIFQKIGTPFTKAEDKPFREMVKQGVPHTSSSIGIPSGYPHYDWWKDILTRAFQDDEISFLTTQKEFLRA